MRFRLDAKDNGIGRLIEEVETFLSAHQVPTKTLYAINVCLDELLVNTLEHGSVGGEAPDVQVNVIPGDGKVIIEISDDAPAFDPIKDAPQPDLEAVLDDRPIGGLGLHLLKHMTDELSYRRADGRNHLRLVKRINPECEPGS